MIQNLRIKRNQPDHEAKIENPKSVCAKHAGELSVCSS